jgi:hypothetical protein
MPRPPPRPSAGRGCPEGGRQGEKPSSSRRRARPTAALQRIDRVELCWRLPHDWTRVRPTGAAGVAFHAAMACVVSARVSSCRRAILAGMVKRLDPFDDASPTARVRLW